MGPSRGAFHAVLEIGLVFAGVIGLAAWDLLRLRRERRREIDRARRHAPPHVD